MALIFFKILFIFLYSRFSLVIHFIRISVYMSIPMTALIFVTVSYFPPRPFYKSGLWALFTCMWAPCLLRSGLTIRQVRDAGYDWSRSSFPRRPWPKGPCRLRSPFQGPGSPWQPQPLGKPGYSSCLEVRTPVAHLGASKLQPRSSAPGAQGSRLGDCQSFRDWDLGAPKSVSLHAT